MRLPHPGRDTRVRASGRHCDRSPYRRLTCPVCRDNADVCPPRGRGTSAALRSVETREVVHGDSRRKTIDVGVPISAAYDQWTQFEEFPRFMNGIVDVRQLDDTTTRWIADINGHRHEWDAEIVDKRPDRVIAWRAVDWTTSTAGGSPSSSSTTARACRSSFRVRDARSAGARSEPSSASTS